MPEYYTLQVSRAEGVAWSGRRSLRSPTPSLYVEVSLSDVVQTTNTIKDNISPSWEETLPLACLTASTPLSVKLKHKPKSRLDFRNKTIGRAKVQLAKLLDDCKDGEIGLDILSADGLQGSKTSATVFLHIKPSSAMSNAKLALSNLVRDTPLSTSRSAVILPFVDGLVTEGNDVGQSDLFQVVLQAFVNAVPAINSIVSVMDNFAKVNPYLQLAWYVTSVVYKLIAEQVNADQKFRDLVETLVTTFSFVKDSNHLRDILHSFEETISKILDLITECCLLMRKHARHSFASRSLNKVEGMKIDELADKLESLKKDLDAGFTRQTAKITEDIKNQLNVIKLLQDLGASPDDDANASERSICFKDTQAGIRNDIKEWVSSGSDQNIFWLNGVAGSGKSTIATTIAEEFRSSSLGAYLLFERGKSKPSRVFRTIACRLAKTNLALASRIYDACKNKDVASNTAATDFKDLFKDVLLSASDVVAGPVLIILDGLDECGLPEDRSQLMKWLEHDFSNLPKQFRFLITSRPEVDIAQSLSNSGQGAFTFSKPPKSHILESKLEHSSDGSRRDVQTYLSYKLHELLLGKVPKDWESILQKLSEAANGLFIWAETLLRFISTQLCKVERLKEFADKSKLLTLGELYGTVFRNAIDWDEEATEGFSLASIFSKIFALILFSKEPLTNVDIDGILDLNTYKVESNIILSRFPSVIAYEAGKPIRLHHTSFSDYLTSRECCSEKWFVNKDCQKQMIAGSCLDVMKSLLRFNICKLKSSFVRNDVVLDLEDRIKQRIPRHLVYACRFWAQHLREAPFSDDLLGQLETFAHEHLLSWFEVLSLIKKFYHQAGQALQNAVDWVENKKPELVLSAFLTEAIKIASTFAVPIAESTPHIYVSMLSLMENDSDVAAHYMQKITLISPVAVKRIGIKQKSALLKIFEGHTDKVTSVELSPDGKRIVSGSWDNTVPVQDVESGEVVAGPFKVHTDRVTSVKFSPDGKRVVSGSHDKTVLVLDVESGKVVAGPFEHNGIVTSVDFSPDGKQIVSGSWDKTIRVWDIESNKIVAGPLKGHTSVITSVGFSPDGKHVVSGSWDKTVLVWDIESRKVVAGPFQGHTRHVTSVGFSTDGKRVVSGSWDKTVLVWDVESGKVVAGPFNGHTSEVTSVGFSPDGTHVVSGSTDNTVFVWNVESSNIVAGPFQGHTDRVTSVCFSTDGKYVISGSYDYTIRVWGIESGMAATNPLQRESCEITSVGFSPDGKLVVFGSTDNMIRVWEVECCKIVAGPFQGHASAITSVGFSPDCKRVVSGSVDNTIRVWDVKSGEVVAGPFEHSSVVTSVGFSPNGKCIVSGSDDNAILVWEVESSKIVAGPFKSHTSVITSVGFSPDGKHIVSGSWDKTVLVWDVESGKVVAGPFEKHTEEVTSVGFSPDGKCVVSGSWDKTVLVWDVESGKVVAGPFKGHTSAVSSVGFSPDGKRVVSGSWDKTILVWDIESRKVVAGPFQGHTHYISSVEFSSDGKHIVSGSYDNTARVWEVEIVEPDTVPKKFSDWTMLDDSWIRGERGELLLWVQPDMRPTLWRPHNIAVLGCQFSTRLDFSNYDFDGKWCNDTS